MDDDGIALTITDPDINDDPAAGDSEFEYSVTDEQLVAAQPDLSATIYDSSPVILPITWGAVAGTLMWRGKVRSAWSRQGYDYDTFKLVTKMRGSPTRIRLLNAVSGTPKNKLQLAKELDVDWKTVDNHVAMLTQSGPVEEKQVVGTAKFYLITESGTRILSLLSTSGSKDRDSSIKN
jgi:predicted transcriptional regulator